MKLISHDLVCSECGNIYTMQFTDTIMKKIYCNKEVWCFKCKKVTEQINIINYDAWKFDMENKEDKTDLEKYLLKITEKNEEHRVHKKIL